MNALIDTFFFWHPAQMISHLSVIKNKSLFYFSFENAEVYNIPFSTGELQYSLHIVYDTSVGPNQILTL